MKQTLTYTRREVQTLIRQALRKTGGRTDAKLARKALDVYCQETGKVSYQLDPLRFVGEVQ